MGYEKFLLKNESKEVVITIDGEEIKLKTREIPWAMRADIRAKSIKWDSTGSGNVQTGLYARECLKYMIVDAPWGATTEMFLIRINDKLGNALEKLVPPAYSDEEESPRVDEVKKE